jgi:hypothetical protein
MVIFDDRLIAPQHPKRRLLLTLLAPWLELSVRLAPPDVAIHSSVHHHVSGRTAPAYTDEPAHVLFVIGRSKAALGRPTSS